MDLLRPLTEKDSLLVIGLMSGTSADGMDAALTRITGYSTDIRVETLAFETLPYTDEMRREILRLAAGDQGGSRDLALFHFRLGEECLKACLKVCEKAGIAPEQVDLVGSHGQTVHHIPFPVPYLGRPGRGTLQLGEPSVISEGLGCPVVSDFRVRDMAAGGQAAPLVPYTEYLLYRRTDRSVGLQNIGGIGNLTVLPAGKGPEAVFAFDTGPGNMVMDQIMSRLTGGRERYDRDGALAASGRVCVRLLSEMLEDPYLKKAPPKSTGREDYGEKYVDALMEKARDFGLSGADLMATATRFTAECIRVSVERFCAVKPDEIVVGGGGSRNPTLLRAMRECLDIPVMTNEDLGFDSEAKEAVAFAILASECVHGQCGNVPSVTGAAHPAVLGKISF